MWHCHVIQKSSVQELICCGDHKLIHILIFQYISFINIVGSICFPSIESGTLSFKYYCFIPKYSSYATIY